MFWSFCRIEAFGGYLVYVMPQLFIRRVIKLSIDYVTNIN